MPQENENSTTKLQNTLSYKIHICKKKLSFETLEKSALSRLRKRRHLSDWTPTEATRHLSV